MPAWIAAGMTQMLSTKAAENPTVPYTIWLSVAEPRQMMAVSLERDREIGPASGPHDGARRTSRHLSSKWTAPL